MKKKIIIWGLIVALLLGIGAGALVYFTRDTEPDTPPVNTTATKADLEAALEYIKTVYKNPSEKTPRDFQRIGNVPVNGQNIEVVWSVNVGEEHVKVVKGENGMITIDVNEQSAVDVPYVLTATISNGTDSVSFSWNHLLPMVNNDMAAIVEEAYKLEVGQSMDYEVTLTGVITRVNTAYDPNYQNITVTIEVAGAEGKPIECYRLKGDGAEDLQIGDTITVTGTLKNYNGKIEFDQGCVLDAVVKGEAVDAPTDIGQILKDAYALEDGKALPYVATLTGKITTINSVYNPAYGNVSVTIVVDGYPEYPILCYRISGEGADNLLIGDTITVKGYITNYAGKIEFEQGSQLIAVEKTGTEIEAPTDVNEILNAAFGLADGESLPYKATLTGVITKIKTPYDPGYKNVTVAIKVNGKTIECYRLAGDGADQIGVDDTITVTGYLMNYHGSVQFAQGCTLDSWKDTGSDIPPADENISSTTVIPEIVTAPKAGTAYKFYLHQKTLGKNLYLTGNMDGFYYETSADHTEAIDVFVEEVSGGYRLYFNKGGVKNYLEIIRVLSSDGKYHNNVVFTTKPTKVLKWNDAIKSFTCDLEIDGEKCDYYFGTYSSYQTMSGSDVTRVTGENAEALDETNFVAHLVTLKETKVSEEEKAFEELKADYPATQNPTTVTESFTRRAYYTVEGKKVQIKWTTDNKAVKIVDNGNGTVTVKVARGDEAINFKLTATITGDDETFTTSWDYKIPAKPSENVPELPTKDGATITIEQALTYGPDLSDYTTIKYKVTGKIVDVYNTVYGNMYIKDAKGNVLTIYGTYNEDGTVRYDEMEVKPVAGDTITVYGSLGQYNGTAQIKNGWIVEHIPGTGEEDTDKPEMTMQEIVDAAYELAPGGMLQHRYTLTGVITSVDTPYSDQYGNVTVTIQVAGREDKPIKCYRLAGDGADKINVGDTITVTGILKNYMGTIEFDQGCTLDSYVKGDPSDVPEKPTPTQPTTPSGGVLIPETVTSPKTGKAYKLYLTQKNLGKTLYLNGEMSGFYFATTENHEEAVDVYVEKVSGGYRLYFKKGGEKYYIEMARVESNGSYHNNVIFTTTPTKTLKWNADINSYTCELDVDGEKTDFYFGTYGTYSTFSASKISYVTGDKADTMDVSNFVAHLAVMKEVAVAPTEPTTPPATQPTTPTQKPTAAPTEPPAPGTPVYGLISGKPSVGVAYKWASDTGDKEGILAFIGTTANKDYYLSTSTTMTEGVDVYVETVTGGYRMYFMDGNTKTYIDIYQNGTYVNARLTDTPTAVFTWNSDFKTFVADIGGTPYYLGTYTNSSGTTFTTLSASKLSYMNPDNVNITQFPVRFYEQTGTVAPQPTTPTQKPTTKPTAPATQPTTPPATQPTTPPATQPTTPPATQPTEPNPDAPTFELIGQPSVGVAYKWAADTGAAKGIRTFIGTTANTNYYLSTSATMSEGVDVFVEEVTGGYRMYFMAGDVKTYIDIYQNGTYVNAGLTTEPTAVFTWNSEFNTFVADIAGTPYYLGTYTNSSGNTFETLSASKLSYMKPDNVDVTNFPCRFYAQTGAVDPQPTTPPATQPTTPTEPSAEPTTPTEPSAEPTTPTEPAPEMTMQEIVDAAYELANGTSMSEPVTLTGVITRVNTPYDSGYGNVTVTITVEGREDKPIMCYRLKGEGADVIKVGDTITVTGTIKNYNGTIEFDQGCTLDSYVVGEAPEDPTEGMTMQELVDYAYQLPVGGYVDGKTLTGKIIEVNIPFSSQYNNVTVTIVVEGREDKPIECFRMKGEGADVIAVGDTITVTGSLTNYDGKIEFGSGCILDSYVKAEPPVEPTEPTTPSEPATEPETQPTEPETQPTEPETQPTEPVSGGSATYVMQNYKVDGELGGGTFTRDLDENVRFTISSGWFTTQARIYKTANGVITSTKDISSITLNVGGKTSTFNVYVSEDGETWTEYQMGVAYTETPYSDVTITFDTPVKHIKFDCPNAQLRIAEITIDFAASSTEPTTPTEPVAPTEPTQTPTEEPTQAPTEEPTVAPTEPVAPSYELIGQPSVGVAYKWAADTGNAKGILTFTGTTANKDYYLSTSTTMTEGVDVYVEEVTGGYRLYFGNEAKTYIDVYQNGTYVNARLTTTPTAVFTWNSDFNTFVTDIAGTTYYLGTYTNSSGTTFDTLSASKLSYMNAGNVDVTQFPVRFYAQTGAVDPQPTTPTEPTVAPTEPTVAPTEPTQTPTEEPTQAPTEEPTVAPTEPVAPSYELISGQPSVGVAYKWAADTGNAKGILTFTGTTANKDYYLSTSTTMTEGVDVYVEEVTGGYRLYFGNEAKTYIDIYQNGTYVNARLTTEPTAVFTWNSEFNTFVTDIAGTTYYLGTYTNSSGTTFDTLSASKLSYMNASNVDVTQFPVRFYAQTGAVDPQPTTPTEPTVAPTEPTVAPTEPTQTPTEEPTQAPTEEPTVAPTEPAAESAYNKITTLDELTTGKYVLVVSNGKAPTVLDGTWVAAGDPVIDGDKITVANAEGFIWDITVDGTSVTLKDSNGIFIKPKTGNSNGIQSGSYNWAVSCENGTFQFKGTGSDTTTLAYYASQNFKFRSVKNTTVSGNATSYLSNFTLYKLSEGTTVEPTTPTEPTVAPTEPTQAPTEEPTVAPTEPAAESVYNKITTLAELTTGKYVMVVSNGYAPKTLSGTWVLAGTPTISGDVITAADATEYVWDLTVNGTSVTLKDSSGSFIAPKAGDDIGILAGEYAWDVVFADGTFQFKGTGNDTSALAFNTDADYLKFRSYKMSALTGPSAADYLSTFTLYKLEESSTTEPTTPTEPTVAPTEPSVAPTEPTVAPTEPSTEMTMVEIVDAAYELASGSAMSESCTLTGVITRVNTAYDSGYKNVTVTITIEGREDKPIMCYRLKGDGADVIAVGDTITVTGTIKNYNGTIEFDQGCTLDSYVKGVAPEDPYAGMTMQELVDAAYALEAGKFIDGKTLTGKIIEVNTAYSDQYSNVTVTIVVEGKEDKPIECFRMKGNGADIIGVGDTITVTGNLTNYNGTKIEFDQGCMLVSYTKEQNGGELDPSDINYVYGSTSGYNNVIKNWGERGVVATGLSPNAKAFYTDNNTSYAALSALTGSSTVSSVPGSALYGELQDLMVENHTKQTSYGDTRYLYCFTDCENSDSSSISCFYSGDAIGPDWDSGSTWNREHCWPKSKTPAGDANNNSTGEVGDIMTLRPTKSNINSSRSNKAYGQSSNYYNPNGSLGSTGYDLRGDVARIVLYTYVRWGNTSYMWGTDGVMENETVLLDWIEADPVDTWELGRNDSVESITGTRNVFVDYPELAFVLFGETVPTTMQTPSKAAA